MCVGVGLKIFLHLSFEFGENIIHDIHYLTPPREIPSIPSAYSVWYYIYLRWHFQISFAGIFFFQEKLGIFQVLLWSQIIWNIFCGDIGHRLPRHLLVPILEIQKNNGWDIGYLMPQCLLEMNSSEEKTWICQQKGIIPT